MDSKTMCILASELVSSITSHVSQRLAPVCAKMDASNSVLNDLSAKVDALEARLPKVEAKGANLRRVA